jgi:putative membrane protein
MYVRLSSLTAAECQAGKPNVPSEEFCVDEPQPRPTPDARVLLSAERTLLAWLRTGLALMGFGFVVARFGLFFRELTFAREGETTQRGGSLPIGISLVGLGVLILIVSAIRHHRYTSALKKAEEVPPPDPLFGVVVTMVVALVGIAMTVYLVALG